MDWIQLPGYCIFGRKYNLSYMPAVFFSSLENWCCYWQLWCVLVSRLLDGWISVGLLLGNNGYQVSHSSFILYSSLSYFYHRYQILTIDFFRLNIRNTKIRESVFCMSQGLQELIEWRNMLWTINFRIQNEFDETFPIKFHLFISRIELSICKRREGVEII